MNDSDGITVDQPCACAPAPGCEPRGQAPHLGDHDAVASLHQGDDAAGRKFPFFNDAPEVTGSEVFRDMPVDRDRTTFEFALEQLCAKGVPKKVRWLVVALTGTQPAVAFLAGKLRETGRTGEQVNRAQAPGGVERPVDAGRSTRTERRNVVLFIVLADDSAARLFEGLQAAAGPLAPSADDIGQHSRSLRIGQQAIDALVPRHRDEVLGIRYIIAVRQHAPDVRPG